MRDVTGIPDLLSLNPHVLVLPQTTISKVLGLKVCPSLHIDIFSRSPDIIKATATQVSVVASTSLIAVGRFALNTFIQILTVHLYYTITILYTNYCVIFNISDLCFWLLWFHGGCWIWMERTRWDSV